MTNPFDERSARHPPGGETPSPAHSETQRPAPGEAYPVDRTFSADDLYTVRAEVTAHAGHLGADAMQVERLLIVTSELATNAVRHGGGSGRLRLWREKNLLFCQVSDAGAGIRDPQRGSERPSPASIGGRGLWLCRQLSDSLEIARTDGRTVITAIIDVSDPASN